MSPLIFQLVPDSQARSRAVVAPGQTVKPGQVILRSSSLATSLLPKSRGQRCDECCRQTTVKACSRCKEAFYCDTRCQSAAWKSHHRTTCALLSNGYRAKHPYISQPEGKQADLDLLITLYGLVATSQPSMFEQSNWAVRREPTLLPEEPLECFSTLLPHSGQVDPPYIPTTFGKTQAEFLKEAWARFENNNFVLHNISSMVPNSGAYAHGIFPHASRGFNHSCSPNAWSAFVLEQRQAWLEIRALISIKESEEITIPYLDPALSLPERQARLKATYGFDCTCSRCDLEKKLPLPTELPKYTLLVEQELTTYVFPGSPDEFQVDGSNLDLLRQLPAHLGAVRHELFFKSLSKRFEDHVHDGPYEDAWTIGRALLALCILVYPPNYPLIGYYGLELAKASWNAHISDLVTPWARRLSRLLDFIEPILAIVALEEEGQNDGLGVCKTLRDMLMEDASSG